MLRQTAAVAVVFIIAMMVTTTSALFEDQVGKFDWFRPGVGHASLAAFYPPSATLKTVYVATWKAVVASFGIGKGDMRWRRVFGSNDTIRCLEVNEKSVFVALSPSNVLYSLDPKNGDVRRVWPLAHTPIGCGMQDNTLTLIAAGPHVATIAESAVKTLETVQFTALEGASTLTSAAASGAITADGAIAVLFEDGSLNQWATPTTKQPIVSANANEAPAGSRLRANVACPAQLFVGACKAAFSVQKDLSISAIADTTTLPLSCDAATGPKLVVSPTGFVTLNDKTTGLRERPGTRLKLVGMRQVDATRIDAIVSSSSGAFQFLKLKVTGSNDVAVQSSWIVEGGLSEVGFGVFPEMRHRLDEPTSSRVHQFGLNDRIVVASRSGMLFSLLSNDSRDDAEWQAFPAGDASIHFPQVRGKCFRVLSLKSVADLIIVRLRFFDSAQTLVQLTYSVFTGELVSQASDVAAKANVFLPDGATVSADGAVSGEALTQQRDFYKINRTSGEINGFTIPASSLQAVPSWTLSLGAPLVAHAVASNNLGAVTSPESMRYIPNATVAANEIKRKYPTANVLVACHYQTDDEGVKILVVSAFDTISGQVLGRMRHKEVDGAVHAIVVDNVIIYHFTSTSSMRSFVGVWELFEHQEGQLLDSQITSPALIGMSFFEKRRTVSGLTARPPQIQAQILNFLQGSIQGMTVTASLLNIARKNIIFATTTGHILSVPLMELRIGYLPPTVAGAPPPPPRTIIVPSTSVVSHKHNVMRGEFILAGPTPLESTSHVLVAGLDLFYTRVSSGKPFDVIDDEFNYQGLVLICAGLTVATLGVRFWALRSKLHNEWA